MKTHGTQSHAKTFRGADAQMKTKEWWRPKRKGLGIEKKPKKLVQTNRLALKSI